MSGDRQNSVAPSGDGASGTAPEPETNPAAIASMGAFGIALEDSEQGVLSDWACALVVALEDAQAKQPEALAIIERHGFVFDELGAEPGNWKHLAFTLYTLLCEVESIAAAALAPITADEEAGGTTTDGNRPCPASASRVPAGGGTDG